MKRLIPISAISVMLVCVAILESPAAEAELTPLLLFDSGKEDFPRYRIPALLLTPKGTLLAFCEGRKDGGGLTGNIDLILKRSSDSGKTWGRIETVADDGANTLGNPCPLIDRSNGTIWLPFTRSLGEDTETEIIEGTSKDRTRVFVTHSKDDGRTWAKPLEITKSVKREEWTWYGTGPGVGLQLTNGRLVVPSYHAVEKTGEYQSHAFFSDDHGQTWQLGETVGDNCSECQIVERRDGSLFLDARTVKGVNRRTTAVSSDGGKTWTKPQFNDFFDPHCQGCLYRLPDAETTQKPQWLFSSPAGPKRHNLTVRLSTDEGLTWPFQKLLQAGDSQYSCLAQLPDGNIGCLYERWADGNYRIFFVSFSLAWLTANTDTTTTP